MPGFVARNEEGTTTTLGRGGSDFSAAVLAHVLDSISLEIWTDVSGMYTANPKIVTTGQTHTKAFLFRSNGIISFWGKSNLPLLHCNRW